MTNTIEGNNSVESLLKQGFFFGDTMKEGLTLVGVFLEGTTPTY
jgi:hypothetical protein